MKLVSRLAWFFVAAGASASCLAAPGVLDRVLAGGKLVIAYRESSVPFSYVNEQTGKPVGYALDLCLRIAETVRRQTGKKDMAVELVPVTSANRVATVAEGKADMECGSTTNNAERRKLVAFTIPHYITGARLLVPATSAANGLKDLSGKTVVSTKGSTPLSAVQQANRAHLMGLNIVEAPDHIRAVEMVENGQADAFVMDDVLLFGLNAGRPNPQALKIVGRFVTTEPLAIMLAPTDAAFKKLVDDEMRRLITTREIYGIYEKWFQQPIPPQNRSLNLPVNYLMRDFWKYPTDKVPF